MHAPLAAALDAVNTLNDFARCRGAWRVPIAAIYYLKDRALREADRVGLARHRQVRVVVPCQRCNGSGRFSHGFMDTPKRGRVEVTDACRGCYGKGTRPLDFIESTIADRWTWHSPVVYGSRWGCGHSFALTLSARLQAAGELVVDVTGGDWRPGLPGASLTPPQVAAAFYVAEELWPVPPLAGPDDGERVEYCLFLGDEEGPACVLCGGAEQVARYVVEVGRIAWTSPACACAATGDHPQAQLAVFAELRARGVPPALIEDPAVVRWIASHPVTERPSHGWR